MRSKGRIRMVLVLCALAAPLQGRAAQIDDLFNKAQQVSGSNVFEAARLYCQVAEMDATYKNAKMMCQVMRTEADKEDKRCETRYSDAMGDIEKAKQALDASKLDDAKQKLNNIKQGAKRFAEAQTALNTTIPQAKSSIESTLANKSKDKQLNEGLAAYGSNDFNTAKSKLSGLSDPQATATLNKIKQYEQAFAQGDQLEKAGNLKAAVDAYQEATKFKADGPGDPRSRAQTLQGRLNAQLQGEAEKKKEELRRSKPPTLALKVSPSSGQAALTVTASANGAAQDGGTTIASQRIDWGDGSDTRTGTGTHVFKNPGTYTVTAYLTDDTGKQITQTQSVRVIEAVVKQLGPEVDVPQTLAEARAAKAKGNIALARGKYMKVLTADKNNAEANAALEELSKMATAAPAQPPPEAQTPGVISDSDQLLAQGITEYYTGNFDDAYSDLKNYLKFKGEKAGLANFYLGVLKATQYHLGGANKHELADAANESFRAAKKAPKFKVPEKYISPKIIKMYTEAPGM